MAALEGGALGARLRHRPGRRSDRDPHAVQRRRPHRLGLDALRRHAHAAAREPEEARHRDHVRRSRTTRRISARRSSRTPSCSTPRRSATRSINIVDIEALAKIAHEAGIPLVRRQHRALALPVPADRMGRRHRGALGDQVHRRPRHHHGRRDRRVGQVQLGQRQVPGVHHALARLPRRDLPRDLRRLRLHHEGAHGDHAHLRPGALADQRLAAAAGPRVAARAHGAALRERARGGEVPEGPSAGGVGELPRACRTTSTTRSRRSTCRRAPPGCSTSASRAARRPASASSTRRSS